jgi:hypothetical protein
VHTTAPDAHGLRHDAILHGARIQMPYCQCLRNSQKAADEGG